MSGKTNKKLRKLVSDNTLTGKPTKVQMTKLKNSYKKLSAPIRGQFLKTLEKINESIVEKTLDQDKAK